MSELQSCTATSEVRTAPVVHRYVVIDVLRLLFDQNQLLRTHVQWERVGTSGTDHRYDWYNSQARVVQFTGTNGTVYG
jgi:hypothetical protein